MSNLPRHVLTAESPEVKRFLRAWHENGRARFERDCSSLVYDEYAPKHAVERRRYIALDRGTGGVFLLDRVTAELWTIKAYGKTNRFVGHLDEVTERYERANAEGRELQKGGA